MKFCEVDRAMEELLTALDKDPETAEITAAEAVEQVLEALRSERGRILEYLAKLVLYSRRKSAELKAEENLLAQRRQRLVRCNERLMEILDGECAGLKTDCGAGTVRYRATSRVEVRDRQAAVDWLTEHNYPNCCRTRATEINKPEVRKLLADGEVIPGLALIRDRSCSLK